MASSSGDQSNYYVDPWQEYRAVQGKMKKRFLLRKPKPIEVTREFANLATRLKEEECPHYAGLCHLAIARHSPGDASSLKNAARLFIGEYFYISSTFRKRVVFIYFAWQIPKWIERKRVRRVSEII